jgi:hypothetical protein
MLVSCNPDLTHLLLLLLPPLLLLCCRCACNIKVGSGWSSGTTMSCAVHELTAMQRSSKFYCSGTNSCSSGWCWWRCDMDKGHAGEAGHHHPA